MENHIHKIENLCRIHYEYKTWVHTQRVASIALNNPMAEYINKDILNIVALCHDLLEDTDIDIFELRASLPESISNTCIVAIQLLTKNKDEDYTDYIRLIRDSNNIYAYIVKLADMKDHLIQKKTLTDKKRKKYFKAIPELI